MSEICGCCGWDGWDPNTSLDLCTECYHDSEVVNCGTLESIVWGVFDETERRLSQDEVAAIQMIKRLAR